MDEMEEKNLNRNEAPQSQNEPAKQTGQSAKLEAGKNFDENIAAMTGDDIVMINSDEDKNCIDAGPAAVVEIENYNSAAGCGDADKSQMLRILEQPVNEADKEDAPSSLDAAVIDDSQDYEVVMAASQRRHTRNYLRVLDPPSPTSLPPCSPPKKSLENWPDSDSSSSPENVPKPISEQNDQQKVDDEEVSIDSHFIDVEELSQLIDPPSPTSLPPCSTPKRSLENWPDSDSSSSPENVPKPISEQNDDQKVDDEEVSIDPHFIDVGELSQLIGAVGTAGLPDIGDIFPLQADIDLAQHMDFASTSTSFANRSGNNNSPLPQSVQPMEVTASSSSVAFQHQGGNGNNDAQQQQQPITDEEESDQASTSRRVRTVHYNLSSSSDSSSDVMFHFGEDHDDEDDDLDDDSNDYTGPSRTDVAASVNDLLSKPKPSYTWNSVLELRLREHGLAGNGRASARGLSSGFNSRCYSSRHIVERLALSHCLCKHTGCVNCLNFNRAGNLLCSGSDDVTIVIWDWANNVVKHSFDSGHTENIFQTKFLETANAANNGFDIVSSSRDGQVRRSLIYPSGGPAVTKLLYKHRESVHKVTTVPESPNDIISVGEDGYIRHKDLRNDEACVDMLKVVDNDKNRRIRLFSISHHPLIPEICVSGCDEFVRVYDKRNMSKTVNKMCPSHLESVSPVVGKDGINLSVRSVLQSTTLQITCSVYNYTGTEILASYSDDKIYLFNNKTYKPGEYAHSYKGHYNHRTVKGVNFFGPTSEYVISGSDCGNIFIWDKNTEAIVNYLPGRSLDVVNCLEPHPAVPVLATSGLEHHVKIWTPSAVKYPPDMSNLEKVVKRNLKRAVMHDRNDFDDRQFHYFIRQLLTRQRRSNDSDDTSVPVPMSSSSDNDSSSEDEYPQLQGIQCGTQ